MKKKKTLCGLKIIIFVTVYVNQVLQLMTWEKIMVHLEQRDLHLFEWQVLVQRGLKFLCERTKSFLPEGIKKNGNEEKK